MGLEPKVNPVEAAAFPKGEGLLLPKLILLDPNENAPPCLTPLVLAKFDPIEGTLTGEEDSLSSSFDSPLSSEFVVDPKPNRKAELDVGLMTGNVAELLAAEPKEKVDLAVPPNGEENAGGAELAKGLMGLVSEAAVVEGTEALSSVLDLSPNLFVASEDMAASFPPSSP